MSGGPYPEFVHWAGMGCHHSKARKYHYDAPKPHTHHFSHHFLKERAQRRVNATSARASSRATGHTATSTYKVYGSKPSGSDDSETISKMQLEIDKLKTNHELTLEKLETLRSSVAAPTSIVSLSSKLI